MSVRLPSESSASRNDGGLFPADVSAVTPRRSFITVSYWWFVMRRTWDEAGMPGVHVGTPPLPPAPEAPEAPEVPPAPDEAPVPPFAPLAPLAPLAPAELPPEPLVLPSPSPPLGPELVMSEPQAAIAAESAPKATKNFF